MVYKCSIIRSPFSCRIESLEVFFLEIAMNKFLWKAVVVLTILFSTTVFAETDPNPDSPIPVLLSQSDSSKILAVKSETWNGKIPFASENSFLPGARNSITLFVTNIELMPKEGANAFRVYLYQKSGKIFELQTEDLIQVSKTVYAVKVRLQDKNGYRGQPFADGESVIYLTWRGLVSNALKIIVGKFGRRNRDSGFSKIRIFKIN